MAQLSPLLLAWLGASAFAQPCPVNIASVQAARGDAASPATAAALGGWHATALPDRWDRRWPGHSGTVWYRVDWQRACAGRPVALALDSIVMAGEVYANGDLLWRDRHLQEPLSRSWNMPRLWLLPESALRPHDNTLWIRVHGIAEQTPGLGRVRIGEPAVLQRWVDTSTWDHRTMFSVQLLVSAMVAVLFGYLWLQRPGRTALGWYALNAMCWALLLTHVLMTEAWPYPDTLSVARGMLFTYALLTLSFCVFTWRFGGQRWPWLERLLWAWTAAAMAATLLAPWRWINELVPIGLLCTLIHGAAALQFPFHAWRTRRPAHLAYAAFLITSHAAAVHDLLMLARVIETSVPLLPYASLLMMLGLVVLLERRLAHDTRRIEQFDQELASSVVHACRQLHDTLQGRHALALRRTRQQFAHDLHDSVGSSLVRSIAVLENVGERVRHHEVLAMFKLLRDDLRGVIDSGAGAEAAVPATPRAWVAPLRHRFSTVFDELGVAAEWLIPEAWRAIPGSAPCLALTRVAEEALANVLKHSGARQVQVLLARPGRRWLLLRISDDGIGFDVAALRQAATGVGLRSMQARIEQDLGGRLRIESAPGRTVLAALLPLARASLPPSFPTLPPRG